VGLHISVNDRLRLSLLFGRYNVQLSVPYLANSRFTCGFTQYFCAGGEILNSDSPDRLSLASVCLYIHIALCNIFVLGKCV
jgi:hypothetical protein